LDSDVDVFQRFENLRDALFHRPDVAEASLEKALILLAVLLFAVSVPLAMQT